ncbi:MAG: OmpA family protein [Deltaproteobacteria bacterium]|nr:MAG: OmpA family protein [Deltaproteobacteria bacterium]
MRAKLSIIVATVGLGLVAGPALAAPSAEEAKLMVPAPSAWAGVFLGANLPAGGWDLAEVPDSGVQPHAGALFGLRVGAMATDWLGVELGAAFAPFTAIDDQSGMAIAIRGHVMLVPWEGAWAPFFVLGGGGYLGSGDLGSDQDEELHWGVGSRGMLGDLVALRVDARHNLTDSSNAGSASVFEFTVGLDFVFWKGAPSDVDEDGVPDEEDACPDVHGVPALKGCPDKDGDGVTDSEDSCPDIAGVAALSGCPDKDGDGITDGADKCPDEAGPQSHQGCPPPPPDTDGDGIIDAEDLCPADPGKPIMKGCPDKDGDGIADKDDRCPDQAGVPSEQGCLPKEVEERFTGSIKGITFATGTAKIRTTSFKLLDDAVKALEAYPTLRLEVSGHTDDQGDDADNQKLSEDRANAVRNYLIDKGIDGGRLVAIGYGETRPVADNKTKKGRAENRRIEFRMIGN